MIHTALGFILIVLSLLFIISGVKIYKKKRRLLRIENIYTAEVVSFIETYTDDPTFGRTFCYFPIYQFENEVGEIIRIESETGSTKKRRKIGDKVRIVYDSNSPEQFFELSTWGKYADTFFIIIGGLICFIVGISFLIEYSSLF